MLFGAALWWLLALLVTLRRSPRCPMSARRLGLAGTLPGHGLPGRHLADHGDIGKHSHQRNRPRDRRCRRVLYMVLQTAVLRPAMPLFWPQASFWFGCLLPPWPEP